MKTKLKEEYQKQQKKQKAKTILKWVACGLGWTALLGAFVGLVALGCKGCANKKVDSHNYTRVIGDYTLNKAVIEDTPYKYYYRYNIYEGLEDYHKTTHIIHADATIKLKHLDSETSGDNGTYKTYQHLELDIFKENGEVVCEFYGSENGTAITDFELLYKTNYDIEHKTGEINSNIQLGFIDSSVDLMNYQGENECFVFLSNIIKNNSVVNLDLSFDMNAQINRYAMIGQSNSVFGRVESNSPYLGNNWCLRGYFKDSIGNTYIGIKILYVQANGTGYLDNSTTITSQMYKVWDLNGAQYVYLSYVKPDNSEVIVNKAVYTQFDNKETYTATSEWVADSFRHLTIIYLDNVSTPLPLQNYSPLEVLQMFNNNTYNTDLGLSGSTGVFGLISQGFSSIASILNMQIIPGITLGLFIFIPFSIMILLACVWLFKR